MLLLDLFKIQTPKKKGRKNHMEPLIVNKAGESIVATKFFGNNINDSSPLIPGIPSVRHAICNGGFRLIQVTETHRVLVCRECMLRVYIPISVITFDDLRKYFAEFQPELQKASS